MPSAGKTPGAIVGNEKTVISAGRASYGKTLLGGFAVDYPCPRCAQPLTTKNDAVLHGDTCPHCKTAFVFDDPIRQAFEVFASERQLSEQKRLAQEAEKEAAREAKRQEKARLDAEAAERNAREVAKLRAEYTLQQIKGRQAIAQSQRTSARDVSDAIGLLYVILILGGIGIGLCLFASFGGLLINSAEVAGSLFVVGVAGAVSLSLTYVLFRMLGAIHGVLVLILERLESDSGKE